MILDIAYNLITFFCRFDRISVDFEEFEITTKAAIPHFHRGVDWPCAVIIGVAQVQLTVASTALHAGFCVMDNKQASTSDINSH